MSDAVEHRDMISLFLERALWLCKEYPGICKRKILGEWLIACFLKSGDSTDDRRVKIEAVQKLLNYFGVPEREQFESDLIRFLNSYSLQSPLRMRQTRPFIENGTDWGRTWLKSIAESSGRLCSFVNYNRNLTLDIRTRSALLLLAEEMGNELKDYASLLQGMDISTDFESRSKRLLAVVQREQRILNAPYDERAEKCLRNMPDGKKLANAIESWILIPEYNFQQSLKNDHAKELRKLLEQYLKNNDEGIINENDLFEIISIINSVKCLVEGKDVDFKIVGCNILDAKPIIHLKNKDAVLCLIQKGFIERDHAVDRLIPYRTQGNNPSGLQPDIVYRFSKDEKKCYLLGDAKNYEKSGPVIALYAMLRYLVAFKEILNIKDETFYLKSFDEYQRCVLFFPPSKAGNYLQPGSFQWKHPVLLAYGEDAKTGDAENENGLERFFKNAIETLS